MVSEKELVERLRVILRTSDLSTTTAASVRRKLEEDFGVDLTERKAFVRDQIDLFLSELEDEKGGNEEGDGVEEGNGEDGQEVKAEEDDDEEAEGASGSGDDGEEEEEEKRRTSGSSRKRLNKSSNEVKKRGGGFTKLCGLSPELQELLGVSELARTEVVKRLWAHIRENNLQDPSNKRKIICNGSLQNLFKVESIDMFQMNKALSKHILPSSAGNETVISSKSKPVKKLREDSDDSSPKGKRQKVGSSGFLKPLQLSDALTKFIGTGESELPRSDVVKRIWDYIKQNNLQDPADKRIIICDEKLKELFQVDSFVGFTVPKLLAAHFVKT
ncbi:Zinc finger CCCH domain-containing protein 19 [Apostasia shenzhenica]|uniref:Zinc finger CCCH domain-containing protein 19 n=1 Tax=Apostasia shenzhenica TaxID=1088818 RepID=A0A2I0APH9_9ASPA|nr:Zinc finger CCCH domain-containing protein 19 [Apostasia shenzhenica]